MPSDSPKGVATNEVAPAERAQICCWPVDFLEFGGFGFERVGPGPRENAALLDAVPCCLGIHKR